MADNNRKDSTEAFERLAEEMKSEKYLLRLYISGMTARSTEAINSLTGLCEDHLKGRYELEIVDLYKHPEMAEKAQIIATPTLVKQLPLPIRRLVGTLSNEERVLIGLNLIKKSWP
jgi:circadian clock protein KaiB